MNYWRQLQRQRAASLRAGALHFCLLALSCVALPGIVAAEEGRQQPPRARITPPKFATDSFGLFEKNRFGKSVFGGKVIDLSSVSQDKERADGEPAEGGGPVFVSKDPAAHLYPPDVRAPVRINPEAPGPFIGMAVANQEGDRQLAEKYADAYVNYLADYIFETRELTRLIGEALIRQKMVDEDSWDGVPQAVNVTLAKSRAELGQPVRPTHKQAMNHVTPDPKGEVVIYYFFSISCSWCRMMAPDIERLYRAVGKEQKVKMVGLLMDEIPKGWLEEYRAYTGLTMPVYDGRELAKTFHIGYAPSLIALAPNANQAYLKTGQQSFEHMLDFVRHVQGVPTQLTPDMVRLMKTPMGKMEVLDTTADMKPAPDELKNALPVIASSQQVKGAGAPARKAQAEIERF